MENYGEKIKKPHNSHYAQYRHGFVNTEVENHQKKKCGTSTKEKWICDNHLQSESETVLSNSLFNMERGK